MKYHFFKNAPDWALNQMAKEVAEFQALMRSLGVPAYANFGTLIGAAREGDFIKGDHDIDLCYLSKFSQRHEVLTEFQNLLEYFREEELLIRRLGPGQCSIRFSEETAIDLFTTWIDDDNNYWMCQWGNFGNAGQFFPLTTAKLRGVDIAVPQNHDKLLTKLYGDWQTPKEEHPSKYMKRKKYLLINK